MGTEIKKDTSISDSWMKNLEESCNLYVTILLLVLIVSCVYKHTDLYKHNNKQSDEDE